MFRWLRRIFVVVLTLLIVAAIVVQIVLSTAVPRRLVIAELQRRFGLRISAASMSTGWFGHSSLRDVTITLPLADQSFLEVPTIDVSHTWLPAILVGRPVRIAAIELRSPGLVIRQEESGRWNAQEAAELLTRAAAAHDAREHAKKDLLVTLPRVAVTDGTIRVIDRRGREATLSPVQFTGTPRGALLWQYESTIVPRLKIAGEIAPGGTWKHDAKFEIADVGPWASPWVKHWPARAAASGIWNGHAKDGSVSGRLDLKALDVEIISSTSSSPTSQPSRVLHAAGALAVNTTGGEIVLKPQQLLITTSDSNLPEIRVNDGAISLHADRAVADKLQVALAGGVAQVGGAWNWADGSADLKAAWEDVHLPRELAHNGELVAALRTPWPGQPEVSAEFSSRGRADIGRWDATIHARGSGRSWSAIDWHIAAPRLVAYRGRQTYAISDLSADLTTRGQTIALSRIGVPDDAKLSGRGAYDLNDGKWFLYLNGNDWPVSQTSAHVRVVLDAWGDADRARLNGIYLASGDASLWAEGFYVRREPKPLAVNVYVASVARGDGSTDEELPLRGQLWNRATLNGTVYPLDLEIAGAAYGHDLYLHERPLGDVTLQIDGHVEHNRVWLQTRDLSLLGGRGSLRANYPYASKSVGVDLKLDQIALKELGDLIRRPDVSGTVDGSWHVEFPSLRKNRIEMDGSFAARDVKLSRFAAESVDGKMRLSNGRLSISPIQLRQQAGRAVAGISLDIHAPQLITANVNTTSWPIDLPRGDAHVDISADTKLDINIKELSATGPVRLSSAEIARDGKPLGQVRAQADLRGRMIALDKFDADLLGGAVQGQATIDVDQPMESRGWLKWRGLDASRLATLGPQWKDFAGTYSGEAAVARATEARPLEPLIVRATLHSEGGAYRGLKIGDARLNGYANVDRIVFTDTNPDPTTLEVAGGTMRVFARLTRHGGEALALQLQSQFDDLSLDQLVHGGDPSADAMPGVMSGTLTLFGNPRQRDRLYGQAQVAIRDTDLGNSDIIALLYDVMSLGQSAEGPTGRARAELRLEGPTLEMQSFRLFNRGTEVRATGVVKDIWKLRDSPIEGSAVGSARPLKNLKLPFMADVDAVLSALQGAVATIHVGGTVGHPEPAIVPFEEIGATSRGILVGDVQGQKSE